MREWSACYIAVFILAHSVFPTAAFPQESNGWLVIGRVLTNLEGQGAANVAVTLSLPGSDRQAITDQAGFYSFENVPADHHYRVSIQSRPDGQSGVGCEDVRFRILDRPIRVSDLHLKLPQSISGIVTDIDTGEPIPNAPVRFQSQTRVASALTDSNGRYLLYVHQRESNLICEETENRYYAAEFPKQLMVDEGEQLVDVNFQLKSAPDFSGLVVSADGTPVSKANVSISLRWRSSSFRSGELDALGTGRGYDVQTDEAGRFHGYARRPYRQRQAWQETLTLKAAVRLADGTSGGVAQAVTQTKDEDLAHPLKVTLAPLVGVTFRLVNPDGEPIANATVTASDVQPGWNSKWGGPVVESVGGRYTMTGLVPGLDYHFDYRAKGYRSQLQSEALILGAEELHDLGDIRLAWWDKKALPDLIAKLRSDDQSVAEGAARMLGELGVEAVDAIPVLIEELRSDSRNTVRYAVAAAIGKIGPGAKQALPHLLQALSEDTGGGVQREAAIALGLIGDPAAGPFLRDAMRSSDSDIQAAAAGAIVRLKMD